MSEDPRADVSAWMKFYPSDWLASAVASGLSLQEQGAYMRLLCVSWIQGGLTTDHERLAGIVGVGEHEFDSLWKTLGTKWVRDPSDGSRLVNPKQERVRREQHQARDRKRRERDRRRDGAVTEAATIAVKHPVDSGLRAQESGDRAPGNQKGAKKRRVGAEELAKAASYVRGLLPAPLAGAVGINW